MRVGTVDAREGARDHRDLKPPSVTARLLEEDSGIQQQVFVCGPGRDGYHLVTTFRDQAVACYP